MATHTDIEDMATYLAGNFLNFASFHMASDMRPADPENWAVVYVVNRDSRALTRANAKAIANVMQPYIAAESDCADFSANHWTCGWVQGYLLRVRTADGALTAPFVALATILLLAEDYPILDDSIFAAEEHAEAESTWSGMSRTQRIEYLRDCRGVHMDSMAELVSCVRGLFPPLGDDGYAGLVDL